MTNLPDKTPRSEFLRFPEDFMFALTEEEFASLKSQFVISSWVGAGGQEYMPLQNKQVKQLDERDSLRGIITAKGLFF